MEIDQSAREEYVTGICARRADAVAVPFLEVSLVGWTPQVAQCHQNVDFWVGANPGCETVRGWITYIEFGPYGVQLTAHSVVRGLDGKLFDITPVESGQPRGAAFVAHQGDQEIFWALKARDIRCPSLDPAADEQALHDLIADYRMTFPVDGEDDPE